MQKQKDRLGWLRQIVVALGYALGYLILRKFSVSHWMLPAGLRLCCLLFVPYRYWPALVVGEMIPLSYTSYTCWNQLGPAWSLTILFPQIALAMPLVAWFRKHMFIIGPTRSISIGGLLLCTLLMSTLAASLDMIHLAIPTPGDDTPLTMLFAWGYFLGSYLGILTVVPLVLVAREILQAGTLRKLPSRIAESRLLLENAAVVLPALVLLTWIGVVTTGDMRQIARIALFVPVAACVLRHGWRGVALSGTAASVAVMLTMAQIRDPGVIQAQAFIAFAISTLLMLGARIAVLNDRDERGRMDGTLALQIAQQSIYVNELRLRQTASAVEMLGMKVQQAHGELLTTLRRHIPALDDRRYHRQAAETQHDVNRIANSIYPLALRDKGFPNAMREGAIARALDKAGVSYQFAMSGRGLRDLAPNIHTALYRLACEVIAHLFERHSFERVRVYVRGGKTNGKTWAVLRIDGIDPMAPRFASELGGSRWITSQISAQGLSINAIQDRARIYGGELHERATRHGVRVALLLHDNDSLKY